jgi:hypothetical protein
MAPGYTGKLLRAIRSIFCPRLSERQLRLLHLVLIFPFLSCQSILEMIHTFGLPRDATYRAPDLVRWECVRKALCRNGYRRLRDHLRKLKKSSKATQSREAVTLITDDSTRETRGDLGGITGNFYNGAAGKVTSGINLQGLVAVIGDGKEVIILDARVVLPMPIGPGKPPLKRTDWFVVRIEELESQLRSEQLSLRGTIASVDCAYATRKIKAALSKIHVPLVSQVHSGRKLSGTLWGKFRVRCWAGLFLAVWYWLHEEQMKPMSGDPGVEYLRGIFTSKSVGRILVLARQTANERKFYFSTDLKMKAITIHRAVTRRWRMERVFWSLKLELGWKQIRDQSSRKVMARIFLALVVYQALIDTAKGAKISTGEIYRTLRRNRHLIARGIVDGTAFSWGLPDEPVPHQSIAA